MKANHRTRDTIRRLSMDARVLQIARILPMDGPITPEQHDEVRQLFQQYAFKWDITNEAIAKAIGVGASTVSQWLNSKYAGDNDKITRAVNDWMERHTRARKATIELPYVPTQIAEDMKFIAELAMERSKMASIVCPAGTGKTLVLKVLASKHRGFYLSVDEDCQPKVFMIRLAKAVGIKDPRGTMGAIKEAIVEKLGHSRRPILIDEAHLLPRSVFSRLRAIYDRTESSIVMAGTHELVDKINDESTGRGQFASRCYFYNALDYVIDAENPDGGGKLGRPLYSQDEVRMVFEQMGVKLSGDAFMLAWALACLPSSGSLRTVIDAIDIIAKKWGAAAVTRERILQVVAMQRGKRGDSMAEVARRHCRLYEETARVA